MSYSPLFIRLQCSNVVALANKLHSRAPALPQVEPHESTTSSLVDVDSPHVSSVPSDYESQEVKTETQAQRLELEAEDEARELSTAASEDYEEISHEAKDKYDKGSREAKRKYDNASHEAEHKLDKASHETKQKYDEVSHEAKHKYDKASHETKQKYDEVSHDAKHKYDEVSHDAKEKYDELSHEAKDKYKEAKKVANKKAAQAKSKAKEAEKDIRENSDNPIVVGNAVVIATLSAALGFGAYRKYAAGELTWKVAGAWAGVVGLFAAGDYYLSQYVSLCRLEVLEMVQLTMGDRYLFRNKYPRK